MSTILKSALIYQNGTVVPSDVTVETPGNIVISDINSGSATSGQAIVANGSAGATWALPACLPNTGGTLTGDIVVNTASNPTVTLKGTHDIQLVSVTASDQFRIVVGGAVFLYFFGGGGIQLGSQALNLDANPVYGAAGNSITAGGAPVASAVLAATSTTQGFLPPRMTNTQRDAIATPAEGLVVYSTSDHALEFYNGTSWKQVATV